MEGKPYVINLENNLADRLLI